MFIPEVLTIAVLQGVSPNSFLPPGSPNFAKLDFLILNQEQRSKVPVLHILNQEQRSKVRFPSGSLSAISAPCSTPTNAGTSSKPQAIRRIKRTMPVEHAAT
jgi:hypothetical protein